MPIIAFYLSLALVPNIQFSINNYLTYIFLVLFICTVALPLISILFLMKNKLVSSLDMNNYKERPIPLFITGLWVCFGYYNLKNILFFSPVLNAALISMIFIVFTSFIISKYWKISLHMLGVGGVTGLFFSLNLMFGGLLPITSLCILFSGVLGVARINENAHSHAQIYVGFLLGFFIETFGVLLL
tara:strand:+ start:338 stop:895 length:558 start_codon:yes stop_codon:yes gene_type:complete